MDEDRQTEFRQTWGPSFSDTNIGYYNNDVEMLKRRNWISLLFVYVVHFIFPL